MKELRIAETAGFCFGVSRSVEMAEALLSEHGECLSYGELIHNADVVSMLEGRGMKVIQSTQQAGKGDRVLIRAHGVKKSIIDELENNGAEVHDATCPRVKAIHKIVTNAAAEGRYVLIVGMKNHPEVEAIRGWCERSTVLEDEHDAETWLEETPECALLPVTLVVQTTQTHNNFNNCVNCVKKRCTNIKIFDTICNATFTRQNEAAELSAVCDAMVVIGGKHSANSVHLAEICAQHCADVRFIERAEELDTHGFDKYNTVGLTAGASTPAWIIKEVSKQMSDEIKIEEGFSFDEMLEETLKPIYNGEKVVGIVTGIGNTEVTVDVGTKYTGIIPTTEFTDGGAKIEDAVKVGDEIEAIVVRVNDVEGTATLSKKRLDNAKFWEDIESAAENGTVVEGVVTEENKGGVVVTVKGVRVFVPASQTDLPRDAELAQLLKKNVKLKITEVNKARKRVVGSIRKVTQAARVAAREAFWNEIEEGKQYKGVVKSLTSYGAFVDIGGVDGMVHVSELSWGRVHNPAEVVSVGDELDVYVISFDKEAKKISLGHKDPNGNPWQQFLDTYAVGSVASVKVVKLMPFGAFAEVVPGVDGLIHISQIADHRIGKPEEAIAVGDVVDAKITAIDEENKKISLSIRATLAPAAEEAAEEVEAE